MQSSLLIHLTNTIGIFLTKTILLLIYFSLSSIKKVFFLILSTDEWILRQVVFLHNESLHSIQLSQLHKCSLCIKSDLRHWETNVELNIQNLLRGGNQTVHSKILVFQRNAQQQPLLTSEQLAKESGGGGYRGLLPNLPSHWGLSPAREAVDPRGVEALCLLLIPFRFKYLPVLKAMWVLCLRRRKT